MKKQIPDELIKSSERFHYNRSGYPQELLRSLLYTVADPDDPYVYDFDGLAEWYDTWHKDDELFYDSTFIEYLSGHLAYTVFAVDVPKEVWS